MSDDLIKRVLLSGGLNLAEAVRDRIEQLERERDGYLAERNNFEFYLQRTHADLELEVAAVDALAAKLAKALSLVEDAFCEGFGEGYDGGWIGGDYTPAWKKSDVKAELEKPNDV